MKAKTPIKSPAMPSKTTVPFPTLKDFGHKLADALHAERTPEAFMCWMRTIVLRYRGRIDDQYGVGFQKHKPTKEEFGRGFGGNPGRQRGDSRRGPV